MTRVIRALGWIALGVAAILALLGLATWPPGGLMFALPFVFFLPAMILGLLGAVLLVFTSGATQSGILRTMTSMITCVAIMAS